MLNELVVENIDWSVVRVFHLLDEYAGISEFHPASFRKYLKERFVDFVSSLEFNYVNRETDRYEECIHLGKLISKNPIDFAFVGIGENSHLTFKDPLTDSETEEAYHCSNTE